MSYIEERTAILLNLREGIRKVSFYSTFADEQMNFPIALNKRAPYEIIAHLMVWDSFMLKNRLPQLVHHLELQGVFKEKNFIEKVKEYSEKNTPTEVFRQFIKVRGILIQQLEKVTEEQWYETFVLRDTTLNLFSYMNETVKHDQHHFKQIDVFLESSVLK